MRAIFKADICVSQPEQVVKQIVDAGYSSRYDYALQTLKAIPYTRWREYDPEDTVRFYSLRLRESGFIRAPPSKILTDGTDWRFFNELKRELQAGGCDGASPPTISEFGRGRCRVAGGAAHARGP
jgi:NitT/TauT family transport system substrate-binding protein